MSTDNAKAIDFLLVYPHADFLAYSQRVLLGILKEAGYHVHLVSVDSDEGLVADSAMQTAFLEIVERSRIIGFGFMSPGYALALRLTKMIKASFPDKIVAWGGPHPTDSYHQMIGEADAIFVGESDVNLKQFVDAVFAGRPYNHLPLVVTDNPKFRPAEKETYVSDLDVLPMPFYDINGQTRILKDRVESSPEYFKNNFTSLQMLTSRGCPYKCTYCANSYLWALFPEGVKVVRKRNVENVINEIKLVHSIYNLSGVVIEDDLFLARKRHELREFVDQYNANIDLPVSITGITPNLLNKDVVDALKDLPIQSLRIGIESMSPAGLSLYKREAPNKNLEVNCANLKNLPKYVMVRYDVIIDNPYETTDDYLITMRIINALPRPYQLNLYHLTFYEGTEIREKAIADGIIQADDMTHVDRKYGALDDTYINSLFKFLSAACGYIPSVMLGGLTTPWALRPGIRQTVLKSLVDAVVWVLVAANFGLWVRRFHFLASGTLAWKLALSRLFGKSANVNWRGRINRRSFAR